MSILETKPIYLQIADRLMDNVLDGTYLPGRRVPSVRDVAVEAQVNANTSMRTFEHLERDGIIFNKRGVGYFVSDNAVQLILEKRRAEFDSDMDYFFGRLKQLGVTPGELEKLYSNYLH